MIYFLRRSFLVATGAAALSALSLSAHAQAVSVTLSRSADGAYHLLRGGKPYFVKGAGGSASLPQLKSAGGNSLRTWGADNIGPVLDEAQRLGLTVCVGIWFGHKEHGFSYDNPAQVAKQQEQVRQAIIKYRNHPAVLAWALGNEMEMGTSGGAVWKAVNDAAVLTKQLDPHHPTLTVVAEIGGDKVKQIHTLCPALDMVGINSYGGAASLPARYKAAGGTKPYVLTEFGPPGTWESAKKPWGAVPELTSTQKAASYRRAYEGAVQNQPLCLGSYAFTWGNKQEATATWYGMFLPDGSRLAAVDTMSELWTGHAPASLCPVINALHLEGPDQVAGGSVVQATLAASDGQNRPLKVRWVLQRDSLNDALGGDTQAKPPVYPEAIVAADNLHAEVRLPAGAGAYRLFAYVSDGRGGAAVGNIPLVATASQEAPAPHPSVSKGEAAPVSAATMHKPALPFVVLGKTAANPTYIAAGWMGNAGAITMDAASRDTPHSGATCVKAQYNAPDGWGGVVWQSPAGDWGDKPGGLDLTGAKHLTFWARGAKGGEVVTFEFGLLGKEKAYPDTATGKLDKIRLSDEWQKYTLNLQGLDLSRIKTGFAWVVAGQGKPVTFYLDDIRFE